MPRVEKGLLLPLRKLLFDPRPEVSRRDLYDFDEELKSLSKYLKEL
jgi:hypothetical protein